MKRTFNDIWGFRLNSNAYMASNQEDTKLKRSLEKVNKKLQPIFDQYNEAMEDIDLDNAATDDDGILKTDEKGGLRFTPEGLKAKRKALKDLAEEWEVKEFEVESYFATEVPEDLNDNFKSAFAGFVIEDNVLETA